MKWDQTRLPDGTIHNLELFFPKLRHGAIPIRKEEHSKKEMQSECVQNVPTVDPIIAPDPIIADDPMIVESNCSHQCVNEDLPPIAVDETTWHFDMLLQSYRNLPFPNKQWAGIVDKEEKNVTLLTLQNQILRRIEVHTDLSIQVFLDEIPIRLPNLRTSVSSEEDLLELIGFIDGIEVCENFKDAKRLMKK